MLTISWSTAEEGIIFLTDDLAEEGTRELVFTENTLQFDCVTSETHEGVSELTEHAVETGAPISDHKREKPRRLTIECLVTNTPLGAPPPSGLSGASQITAEIQPEPETTESGQSAPGQRARANVLIFSAPFDRMTEVFETLDRLRVEATFVTITTRVKTYDALQIVSVTSPREPGDGDSIRFSIECSEVRIAQTRTIDTPEPREPRGATTTDRGAREGSAPLSSSLATARDEYAERREAGESRTDAFTGTMGSLFGG
jgi:hypothetical protein